MLGLSYPNEWEAFLNDSPPELVSIIAEALEDTNVSSVLVRLI